jgi:acetyltransferase-like isoleucine patch superfamily enzyme
LDINVHLLVRRLLRRATCRKDPSARITSQARIVNIGKNSDLISIGAHTIVRGELLVFAHGGCIEIGEWCYVGEGTRIWSGARISIADRVMISHGVNVFDTQTHPLSPRERHQHYRAISIEGHPEDISLGDDPIVIEEDVWIAAGAIILQGVTLGRGAIVGAGAVVTGRVEAMTIVAGNPARVVGEVPPDA